jgi:hypothetical protein
MWNFQKNLTERVEKLNKKPGVAKNQNEKYWFLLKFDFNIKFYTFQGVGKKFKIQKRCGKNKGVDKKTWVICADTRFYVKPMSGRRLANNGAHAVGLLWDKW